jgi:ABC-type cobalamin/Fe3+-siderophores transport system ATPase subunit
LEKLHLLDEPTSQLDLDHRDRIVNVLRALAQQDVTIIFTTHDPNRVASTAGYVMLLRQARLRRP